MGICRLDPGAEGIHLAWNPPEVVCLSSPGFDIQRRVAQSSIKYRCYSLNSDQFSLLRTQHELASPLGVILYSQTGPLRPIDSSLGSSPWPSPTGAVDKFTFEFSVPTNHVRITCLVPPTSGLQPFAVFAIALSGGKAIAFATNPGDNTELGLDGNEINSVAIFTVSPIMLTVCVAPPADADGTSWQGAPYVVRGLTLPIHEADPTLTPATELAAALKRLVPGDVFTPADFANLTPPLRAALSQASLGRTGERILVGRTAVDDPYQEVTFGDQLTLLQIFPAIRRVLGFGFFDREANGLVHGLTYEYRITGYFNAADLGGGVYDFHTIPSGSTLPATFYLRDLRFSFKSPVSVVLDPAPPATALNGVSRRGIQINANKVLPGWIGPSLDTWDVIIDLPYPAASITLEANAAQQFVYAVGDAWAFTGTGAALPPGAVVALSFATPITQIRLAGTGVLFAIRVPAPAQSGVVHISVTTPPIPFTAQPLPAAPLSLTISNLQEVPGNAVLTNVGGFNQGPKRPLPGFDLAWLPASTANVIVWPSDTNTAPPMDAMTFQIEHREVTLPATFGPWEPILPGENISLGTRDNTLPNTRLEFASNVADVFPSRRPRTQGAGYLFHLSDMFSSDDTSEVFKRPVPAFGTYHQYRIRAIDTVGRVSADWTLSNILRLEKHVPPPLPVGPQPEPALTEGPDGSEHFASPPGVKARVLVVNDPSLTANDLAILGFRKNAIVLDWGWRDSERQTDKLTTEFRVYYLHDSPVVIPGEITSVTADGQGWNLAFQTNRTLTDGECVGQWLSSNGYPFRIDSLTGGPPVVVHVEAARANPAAAPVVGPAFFGRSLRSDHQRPASWEARAAVIPLTTAESYRYLFYDLLNLSPDNPRESIWVGVSAADSQDYVPDELPAAVTNGGRSGNESSIVTCAVTGRDFTRPMFSIPPPLGDVPELVTEEPGDRQILVSLDVGALLPGALPAGTPIGMDRCSIDTLFSITSLNASNQVQLAMNDGASQIVTFPNPGDEAEVVATLQSANPERMASRYLMYLATQHLRPDEIFPRISGDILAYGVVGDRLPPKPARFFYRIRRADALGRVSAGGAILPVVVRVPSNAPPAAPQKVSLSSTPTSASITLRVPGDPDIAWLLVFSTMLPVASPITDLSGAELLRIPNRRDLYPLNGLRLRYQGSSDLLLPVAKSLADPDVTTGADGSRSATIHVPAAFGNYVILWTYSLSKEGIPSRLTGPFTWGVPKT